MEGVRRILPTLIATHSNLRSIFSLLSDALYVQLTYMKLSYKFIDTTICVWYKAGKLSVIDFFRLSR